MRPNPDDVLGTTAEEHSALEATRNARSARKRYDADKVALILNLAGIGPRGHVLTLNDPIPGCGINQVYNRADEPDPNDILEPVYNAESEDRRKAKAGAACTCGARHKPADDDVIPLDEEQMRHIRSLTANAPDVDPDDILLPTYNG